MHAYPACLAGFPDGLMGTELVENMRKQSIKMGTTIYTETVTKVSSPIADRRCTHAWRSCDDIVVVVVRSASSPLDPSPTRPPPRWIYPSAHSRYGLTARRSRRRPSSLPQAPSPAGWTSLGRARTRGTGTRGSQLALCATAPRPSSARSPSRSSGAETLPW